MTPQKTPKFAMSKKPTTLVHVTLGMDHRKIIKNKNSKKHSHVLNNNIKTRPKRIITASSNQEPGSEVSSNLQTLRDESISGISMTNNSLISENDKSDRINPIKLISMPTASQNVLSQRKLSFDKSTTFRSRGLTPSATQRDPNNCYEDCDFTKKVNDTSSCISHTCSDLVSQKPNITKCNS